MQSGQFVLPYSRNQVSLCCIADALGTLTCACNEMLSHVQLADDAGCLGVKRLYVVMTSFTLGTMLASGSDDLEVAVWNLTRATPYFVFESGHRSNVFQVQLTLSPSV